MLAGSGLVIFLMVAAMIRVGTELRDDDEGVGESGEASRLMQEKFRPAINAEEPQVPSRTERLIFSSAVLGVNNVAFRSSVEDLVATLRDLPHVTSVVTYYDLNDPDMVSLDRQAMLGWVTLQNASAPHNGALDLDPVLAAVDSANEAAPMMEIGVISFRLIEEQFEEIIDEDFSRILIISLVLGLGILILAFRALVAAVIPLAMALGAIFSAIGMSALVSHIYPLVDLYAEMILMMGLYAEMILMMGLAVGIDYSLFVVSRFRSERSAGRPKLEAIYVASNTTGRAVFYAGVTVVLSLAGLMLTEDPVFISLSLGAIIVVLFAILGSLTLLPALLSALGGNVNALRIPYLGRETSGGGVWGAITDRVLARPALLATAVTAGLIALAVPVFSLNLGFNAGADSLPDAVEGKRAVESLEKHFSSTLLQPARVVVDHPDVRSPEIQDSVGNLVQRLEQDSAFLGPFEIRLSEAGDLLRITVPIAGKVDDDESENALKLLRNELIPDAFSGTSANVYVAIIETWLPLFLFGILFGLSMDYHMLMLNRIKEAHDQGYSNEESVSVGIKSTAGQITSAAAIMVGVFATFATSRVLGLQQF